MSQSRKYTYEEVLGQFHKDVDQHVNDASRVPARKPVDKIEKLLMAGRVYNDKYRDVLHNSVLDKYK